MKENFILLFVMVERGPFSYTLHDILTQKLYFIGDVLQKKEGTT